MYGVGQLDRRANSGNNITTSAAARDLTKDAFTQAVRSYIANKREAGVIVKDRHCWRDNIEKKQCTARQVVLGATLILPHECDERGGDDDDAKEEL